MHTRVEVRHRADDEPLADLVLPLVMPRNRLTPISVNLLENLTKRGIIKGKVVYR